MPLKLTRPLIVFDLESTGLSIINDRIVEISYVKVYPDGREETYNQRVNPGMHIPDEVVAVHGIKDEDVKDMPPFKQIAPVLAQAFKDCDFAGFNSNHFDIPLLTEEMLRAGVDFDPSRAKFIDVQNIFHKRERRDLEAACLFYCGHPMQNHHSAPDDARTTLEVLRGQIEHYDRQGDPLPDNVAQLAEYSTYNRNVDLAGRFIYDKDNNVVFNFGKHRGKLVAEVLKVEPSYYDWMMRGEFPENTKQVLTRLYLETKNKK